MLGKCQTTMHAAEWPSRSGRCYLNEAHAKVKARRGLAARSGIMRKLRHSHRVPHAFDPDLLDHLVKAQAALTTAGLMLTSAALGTVAGRRMASASSEHTEDIQSTPAKSVNVMHILSPSSRRVSADSVANSAAIPSSRQDASVQNASAQHTTKAQTAEDRSAVASSQLDSEGDPSRPPSAAQLWEGAWKAFEEPEQKQGSSGSDLPPVALARDQRLEHQQQSSFPSLAARLFREGTRSRAQDRSRQSGAQQGKSEKKGPGRPDQDVWAKPQLALQGIAPAARVRLLACALASIEKQISTLPDALDTASPEQWRLATQAITASCAVTSARAWIGYIPQGLIQDAQEALQQLVVLDSAAGDPQKPAGDGPCSSFGQLLTSALPNELQPLLKSSSQLAKPNKGPSSGELQDLTPLASLQIEKARIHGALVSYLKCGWRPSSTVQPGMTQSPGDSLANSAASFSQSSVSSEQRDLLESGESAEQGSLSSAQRRQQQISLSGEPQQVTLGLSMAEQTPSSSGTIRVSNRRAEAMAALEGRQQSMSSG